METNNIATFLQTKSNKITRVLIYAFLEWTLIALLLLNSLFSLLIHKFAIFFGLKPPCIFCSRLDHSFLQTQKADIICGKHAAEISEIGYCSHHGKLVESQNLCLSCSIAVDDGDGGGDAVKRCSCCDGIIKLSSLDRKSDDFVINQRGEVGFDSGFKSGYEILDDDDDDDEDEKEPLLNKEIVVSEENVNLCPDIVSKHLDFYIDHDDYRLIPVDLVNSKGVIFGDEEDSKDFELILEGDELLCGFKQNLPSIQEEEEDELSKVCLEDEENEGDMVILQLHEDESMVQERNFADLLEEEEGNMGTLQFLEDKSMIHERNFANLLEEDEGNMVIAQPYDKNMIQERSSANLLEEEGIMGISQPHEEEIMIQERNFTNLLEEEEGNMGISQFHEEESMIQERNFANLLNEDEEKMVISQSHIEGNKIEVHREQIEIACPSDAKLTEEDEISERSLDIDVSLSQNELEDERICEKCASVDSMHTKVLPFGRSESVTEESERKTLRELYKELEEERSASAIAANHTMAMINRLQEEKATMQIEALQYQRMLEEQSEYDQEALQMMNELMVKREREKQDLEKDVEVLRKKVVDYEEKERTRVLCRRKEGRRSSASCSYGEESDGLSIDLNHEAKDHEEEDTPNEVILGLQESLSGFEEERQAILEQLKGLEEKLFTLVEEEEEVVQTMKPFEQFYEENGDNNGFSHVNGKHELESRLHVSMQKRLLPLFDATELMESSDGEIEAREEGFDYLEPTKSPIVMFELEKKRIAIEQEVDLVYERLQALEADREFLKHCIGSLRKGDKGLDLLQEILQHLRDLKSVELQAMKNMDHCA